MCPGEHNDRQRANEDAGDREKAPQRHPNTEGRRTRNSGDARDREREQAFDQRLPELDPRVEESAPRTAAYDHLDPRSGAVIVDESQRTFEQTPSVENEEDGQDHARDE